MRVHRSVRAVHVVLAFICACRSPISESSSPSLPEGSLSSRASGQVEFLPVPETGYRAAAVSVNESGLILGQGGLNLSTPPTEMLIWKRSTLRDIISLAPYRLGSPSNPVINASGDVGGMILQTGCGYLPFVWRKQHGLKVPKGAPCYSSGTKWPIFNDAGVIGATRVQGPSGNFLVLDLYERPYNKPPRTLSVPGNYDVQQWRDMNNAGQVLGFVIESVTEVRRPFIAEPNGEITFLSDLGFALYAGSVVYITDAGALVGQDDAGPYYWLPTGIVSRPTAPHECGDGAGSWGVNKPTNDESMALDWTVTVSHGVYCTVNMIWRPGSDPVVRYSASGDDRFTSIGNTPRGDIVGYASQGAAVLAR